MTCENCAKPLSKWSVHGCKSIQDCENGEVRHVIGFHVGSYVVYAIVVLLIMTVVL